MEPDKYYHLYTHANGFENLFRSEENYRFFLRRYADFIPSVAHTLVYCLMPNHVHFLVRIKTEAEIEQAFGKFKTFQKLKLEARISKQFANLFSSYTQAFNKMYGRRGSLFIPNFKRKVMEGDSYMTNVICYIHRNPVHHGFVKKLTDWPWSSYTLILNGAPTFINRDDVLAWFGNGDEYSKIHHEKMNSSNLQGLKNIEDL